MSSNKSITSVRRCRKCGVTLEEKVPGPTGAFTTLIKGSKDGLCNKCLTKRNRSPFKNKRRF